MGCDLLLVVCSRSSSYFAVMLRPFLCVLLWYSLALLLGVLNDWYLRSTDFFYPFYLHLNHMLVLFLAAYILKHTNWYTRIYFGSDLGEEDERELRSAYRSFPTWRDGLWAVGGMSVLAALSLTARTLALLSVDAAVLQTADMSLGLLVVYGVGVIVKQEKLHVGIALSMVVMVGGIVTTNWQQLQGIPLGFGLAGGAALADALLVVLLYGLLRGEAVTHTPLDLIVYFSLPTFVLLLPPFFVLELPRILSEPDFPFFRTLLLVSAESVLYFCFIWSAILLLSKSTALSFEVLSSLQPLLVFLAALVFFRQRVTLFNVIGSGVLFSGIFLYILSRNHCFSHLSQLLHRLKSTASSSHVKLKTQSLPLDSMPLSSSSQLQPQHGSLSALYVPSGDYEDWSGI